MKACAELDVEAGGRMRWTAAPPVVLRRTGASRVHLVQAAGGPLGGDQLELRIRVAADAELTVGSAGATVAQPGRPGSGPAFWTVTAELAPGARLTWTPEPTVVCDGAELRARLRVVLADGAGAVLREQVQLGRHGQRGGRYRGELSIDHAGVPLVRHTTVFDGADPALSGPGGTAGARALSTVVGAGSGVGTEPTGPTTGEQGGVRWARHRLVGPGWMLLALGPDTESTTAALTAVQ